MTTINTAKLEQAVTVLEAAVACQEHLVWWLDLTYDMGLAQEGYRSDVFEEGHELGMARRWLERLRHVSTVQSAQIFLGELEDARSVTGARDYGLMQGAYELVQQAVDGEGAG